MTLSKLRITALALGAVFLTGCGFKPIYATATNGDGELAARRIAIGQIAAPEEAMPYIVEMLEARIVNTNEEKPLYRLNVSVQETAQRLAVQIDATVTRYNYRLTGSYQLVDLTTKKQINGRVSSVTSYNIVDSQYSTLFAERTAQEKAARLLAENIERDVLIRLSSASFTDQIDDEVTAEDPIFDLYPDAESSVEFGNDDDAPIFIDDDN